MGQVCRLKTPNEDNASLLFIPLATVLYCRLENVLHPFFIHRNLLCWFLRFLKARTSSGSLKWEVMDLTLPACIAHKPAVSLFSFLPTAPPTPNKSVIDKTIGYTTPRRSKNAKALFEAMGTTGKTDIAERIEKEGHGPKYVHRRYDFETRIGFENAARIRLDLEPLFGKVSPSVHKVFYEFSKSTPEFYYFEQGRWEKQNSIVWEWDFEKGSC